MSGTPVIRLAKQALAGVNVQGFEGILNGTSNYVLTQMKDGLAFNDALVQAQQLGYAEADPTADVEGFDVRLKVVILANELLKRRAFRSVGATRDFRRRSAGGILKPALIARSLEFRHSCISPTQR